MSTESYESCTELQYGKRFLETFHKTLYPFKELQDISVSFSKFASANELRL